jgi:hypothetical protein
MAMGEFLFELLLGLLEPFLEALFEYLFVAIADLLMRALGEVFTASEIQDPVLAACGYALFGLMLGGLSLLLFPHRFLHSSRFHGISLLVSPAIAGLMMSMTGAILRWRDKIVTQLESFGYGFFFAFGIALVRFIFAK